MNDLDERILKDRQPPSDRLLRVIVNHAERAVVLEQAIAVGEKYIEEQRKELHALRFVAIPDLMLEAGLTGFALKDGSRVKVEDYVQGSLPKDPLNRQTAIGVLEAHGGEALIKSQVVLDFEKKEHNKAISVMRELQDRGLDVNLREDVHHSTLQAFVREKLRAGEEIPYEKLGIFVGRRAVIKPAEGGDAP